MKECWLVRGGRKEKGLAGKFDGYFYIVTLRSIIGFEPCRIRVPKSKIYFNEKDADAALAEYSKHTIRQYKSVNTKAGPEEDKELRKRYEKEPWRMWTWAYPGLK